MIGCKNGVSSEKVPVTSGVPQGSVLGPTLFIFYINDLPSVATAPIKIFADDAKNHKSINDEDDQVLLQNSINYLVNWSEKWLLGFNTSKCNMMHLGKSNPQYTVQPRYNVPRYNIFFAITYIFAKSRFFSFFIFVNLPSIQRTFYNV